MASDLSILIPARNEMFLARTIEDILTNIEADTEVIAVLDGTWAQPAIPQNERVNVIYLPESIGQRAATNLAAKLSRAKFVMKIDAHCAFDLGFDRKMIDAFKISGEDVTMVPIMRNLWAFDWKCFHCGWKKYQGPTPQKCENCGKSDKIRRKMVWIGKDSPQSTSYSFDAEPHFQYFGDWKHRPQYKKEKEETGLTETMSLQGSCFMTTREKFWELELSDEKLGNWGNQGIEVAVKTWLSGNRVLVNHKTWYAHMFRTQGGDFGFPWLNSGKETQQTKNNVKNLLWTGAWPKQTKPLSWLLEKFWPVPGWTEEDLANIKAGENKSPVAKATPIVETNTIKFLEGVIQMDSLTHQTKQINKPHVNIEHKIDPAPKWEKKLKKTIYTLNFDNYSPKITKLTYPFFENYAKKIGAEFKIITKRKFPKFPMMYEKLQIYEMGRENDWNIYIDSDCLIHPDLFDITEIIPQDTVLNYGADLANTRFHYDNYFRRDGRNIGCGNFLAIASHLCLDYWEPPDDITVADAIKNIKMTHREEMLGHKPGYGIDDYITSRNIAKYHLKFKTFLDLLKEIDRPLDEYFFHNHLVTEKEKILLLKKKIHEWRFY